MKTRLNRGVRKLAASLPRGLAFGTAVALCAGRGLPATRRAVMRCTGASAAGVSTFTGLLAMKKTALPIAIGALAARDSLAVDARRLSRMRAGGRRRWQLPA
ncbi:MAG TPA: hypothetical protein VK348_10345 [Planctomycetota bacterium]|nr:hypothetical protein [Planctomycetota bacterium]